MLSHSPTLRSIDEFLDEQNIFTDVKFDEKEREIQITELRNLLQKLNSELSKIGIKAANKRRSCQTLESDLSKITKAIQQNTLSMLEYNLQLEKENLELQNKISGSSSTVQNVSKLVLLLSRAGIDLSKVSGIDYPYLMEVCSFTSMDLEMEALNPEVEQIIQHKYFRNCFTNNDFIRRCSELSCEVQQLKVQREQNQKRISTPRNSRVDALKQKLLSLQKHYTTSMASISSDVNEIHSIMENEQKSQFTTPDRNSKRYLAKTQSDRKLSSKSRDMQFLTPKRQTRTLCYTDRPTFETPRSTRSEIYFSPTKRSPYRMRTPK